MKTRFLRRGKLAGGLGLLLALALIASLSGPALAIPPQPHQFLGYVRFCDETVGQVVEPGTVVLAKLAGVDGLEWTTTVDSQGRYGVVEAQGGTGTFKIDADDPATGPKEGGVEGVDTVEFWVLGYKVAEYPFEVWQLTTLNLVVDRVTLTVAASPIEGGTVTGGGTYDCSTPVDVEAIPTDGWYFTGWTGDLSGTENPTTIHIDGIKTVTANFALIGLPCELTVNASPVEGGTVTGGGTYACGTDAAITATVVDECWYFTGWTGEGITNPDLPSTTVLVDVDKTVTANFAKFKYVLTVVASPAEGGTVTGDGSYDCCTDAPITATAADGYIFTSWTGTAIANPASASTTVHIDDNKTVTAHFMVPGEKKLTIDSTAGGSVTDPGEGEFFYTEGTVVDLLAVPECGFVFGGWTGDIGTVDNPDNPDTFIVMSDDYEITANFVSGVLMEIPLGEGWNTFSTPIYLDPCCDTWGELAAVSGILQDEGEMVYYYDVSSQTWGLVTDPLHPVQPLEGFYVYLLSEGTIPIIPYWDNPDPAIPPSKELFYGLNFIGTPSLEDLDVDVALLDIYLLPGVGYSKVFNPEENVPNDWPVNNTYIRDFTTPVPTMVAFKAYWVIMGISEEPLYLFGSPFP